jgi:hypothetical protein
MKSPIKRNWFPLQISCVVGLVLVIFLYYNLPDFTWMKASSIYVMWLIMGLCISFANYTIFKRRVDYPVDPKDLIFGEIYWLNGETHAMYLGQSEYSGKYRFNIWGYDKQDGVDFTSFFPGEVKAHIAASQEVFD